MKTKTLTLITLITISLIGVSILSNHFKEASSVEAAQHLGNFADYTYTGTYYNSLNFGNSSGMQGTFRSSLSNLIYPDGFYTYGSSGETHLSTQLQYADEDPNNSQNMIYFYTRDSVKKNAASSWNREHVWPQSLSNDNWGTSEAGTDLLHIRPTYNDTNSRRGNLSYGDTNKTSPVYYQSMLYGYANGYFEPLDEVKGDAARILMYMWTTYYDHYTNKINILSTIQSYDVLLRWHTLDKPDALEGNRNDYAETSIQKNRNPFVDHPEYAWKIFGDNASSSVRNECIEAYPGDGSPVKTVVSVSLSGEATKKNYIEGETFNPTGLTVTAQYDDDSTVVITNSQCSWLPDPLTAGTTTVTCKYGDLSAIYSGITVEEDETPIQTGVTFGVDFIANGSDTGDLLNGTTILNSYVENNTLAGSITNTEKCFPGKNGLKLGSSTGVGKLTINVLASAQQDIESIKIETQFYSSNTDKVVLQINGGTAETFDCGTYTKDLGSIDVTSITITSVGRIYLNSIILEKDVPVVALENITLDETALTLYVAEAIQLNASFYPENATDKSVTWESSNINIATVSNTGYVTALSEGIARITVKNSDDSIEAYCDITIIENQTNSSNSESNSSVNPISSSSSATSSDDESNSSTVVSISNSESSIDSSSSNPPVEIKSGCFGSITMSLTIVAFTAVIGLGYMIIKSKKEK